MLRALASLAFVLVPAAVSAAPLELAGAPPPRDVGMAPVDEAPRDPLESRTELGFGVLLGSNSVGPVRGSSTGFHLDVARWWGPLALVGEYDLLGVGETTHENPEAIRGRVHRGGASLRYAPARFGGGDFFIQGALWAELGAGVERVVWDGGGRLDRWDVSAGVGGQANFRLGDDDPSMLGVFYAFRFLGAPGPGKGGEPTCAGPCDQPTAPYGTDLGFYFNLGLVFAP